MLGFLVGFFVGAQVDLLVGIMVGLLVVTGQWGGLWVGLGIGSTSEKTKERLFVIGYASINRSDLICYGKAWNGKKKSIFRWKDFLKLNMFFLPFRLYTVIFIS